MDNSIKKGVEIRNQIGSTFKELKILRKGVWSNAVLNDKAMSIIDTTYERKFNDYDVVRAEKYQEELILINKNIENLLGTVPAEEDQEIIDILYPPVVEEEPVEEESTTEPTEEPIVE